MWRTGVILALAVTGLLAPSGALAQAPATPPCPQVQGWTPDGTFGPIDTGIGVQFQCVYSLPGQPQLLTLDMHWIKPSARDVDVDYTQCGRASSGGSYYTDIYSGSNLVREEYVVNSGSVAGNAAVFQAEQQHIQQAALVLLTATESLAKSCTPSSSTDTSSEQSPPSSTPSTPPPSHPTARPTVHVKPAKGRAGSTIAFRFTVSDLTGPVNVLLTIYQGSSGHSALLSKNYGRAKAGPKGRSYIARIRARNRGAYLWCVTASNAAGNKATACNLLVVR